MRGRRGSSAAGPGAGTGRRSQPLGRRTGHSAEGARTGWKLPDPLHLSAHPARTTRPDVNFPLLPLDRAVSQASRSGCAPVRHQRGRTAHPLPPTCPFSPEISVTSIISPSARALQTHTGSPLHPSSVLLSVVSVIRGQLCSKNTNWTIPEVNNSQILKCMPF